MTHEYFLPERGQEKVKLNDDSVDKEGIWKGRPRIVRYEGHQESKSNEHHYIDVLIHGVIIGIDCSVIVSIRTNKNTVHYDNKDLNKDQ